jgi:polyisoprenoid-binding protein YceI
MPTWNLDPSHSRIAFQVRHMVFAKVHGAFTSFSASLELDENDLTRSKLDVAIDAASIATNEEKRDLHLKSADFLDAEKFPKLLYKSKRIEKEGATYYRVVGDLTIHGITKEVPLAVEFGGKGKDPWGNERMGFSAKAQINRTDFGLTWNQALEAGGLLVGEKVDIGIDLEVVKGA